jgi:23S rRNA (cytidine1920-2'-O)/16S rRNA (cytidine1409-2'-O)-methyltransferase
VGGLVATNPARLTAAADDVALVAERSPYVSRGGKKLAAALGRFDVAVTGTRCLDVGSSTGGFTDALLQAGAEHVVAVDVGTAQLHRRLLTDPRVTARERTDIRRYDPLADGGPFPIVVADLSFISVSTVAAALVAACDRDLVVLVKPQFEATRDEASLHRGVIRDPVVRQRCLDEARAALEAAGGSMMDLMESPITGAEGNVEYLVHLRVS